MRNFQNGDEFDPSALPPVPTLFGRRATSILMYLAVHPGCSAQDLRTAMGMTATGWNKCRRRLLRHKLVVGKYNSYQINPSFRGHIFLRRTLRAMARTYGVIPVRKGYRIAKLSAMRGNKCLDFPDELFESRRRAHVLMALVGLGEAYAWEISEALRIQRDVARLNLLALEKEGVVISRWQHPARACRINPEFPGADSLVTLMRRMALRRPWITAGVQNAFLRREMLLETADARDRALISSLRPPAMTLFTVQRERAEIARRAFMPLKPGPREVPFRARPLPPTRPR